MSRRIVSAIVVSTMLVSCNFAAKKAEKLEMPREEAEKYQETLQNVQMLERNLAVLDRASVEDLKSYADAVDKLYYDYNPLNMTNRGDSLCRALKKRVDIFKKDAGVKLAEVSAGISIQVKQNDDLLLEKTMAVPIYLERGDVLFYTIELQNPGTIKLYNADTQSVLRSYAGKTRAVDSLNVANRGIYLLEINPGKRQYVSMNIYYKAPGLTHPLKYVTTEVVGCGPGDFRAVATQGILMKAAFDEPRKFTLRSQLKAAFSGSSRALVPVQIPSGATEILYSLRISTSEQDRSSDGKFPDKMNLSYKKIRFLGLPLYESSRSNGLFSTLLDDNRPLREEDAYCNMYVFRNQKLAKLFQDGTKAASQLSYDVDYSTLGTQSCSGRIPAKGAKTIYLAFENERVRFTNYIWVEVLTATPIKEYHTEKYSVK